MYNAKKVVSEVTRFMMENKVRPDVFFSRCMEDLKKRVCPIVVEQFHSELQKIKAMSCACQTIERLHVEERIKGYSSDIRDLLFLHLIKISDCPTLTLKEGLSLELSKMAESVRRTAGL